ncbi:MAG: IPTL-CTERM sorting domain-containing protein [Lysobacterales bacterium]
MQRRTRWGMSLLAAAVTFVTGLGPAMSEPVEPATGIAGTGISTIANAKAGEKAVTAFEFDAISGLDGSKVPEAAGRPVPPFGPTPRMAQVDAPFGQGYVGETEPNGTFGTATPLASTNTVVRAQLFPNGDIDFFSFTANAGDRVYAAILTSFSAGSSTDSQLTLLASDGTTIIEFDDDNGSFAALSSSIAGATIPTTGTYYLRVNDFTAGTTSERGYELHLRVQSGAPTAEVEPNDTPATANTLPASGWVSGTRDPAVATEQDWYAMNLNAGDTVFLSLDVDPEDDLVVWNGRLGIGLFGDAGNQILVVDDAGTGDVAPNPNRPSEALFMTVKDAGTYYAFVDSASAAVGGPTATYQLSVSIRPHVDEGVNCTTYTSTNVPQTIGPGTGLVSSTITVPGNPRIADVDVQVQLNHALMQDIDAHLRSPAGQDIGLFTDIGAAATGGQTQMDLWFDDEAGVTPAFTALRGMRYKPENNATAGTASTSGAYRLSWFDGINGGGTWTLDLRDDTAGANGGTLTGWALRICEAPPPPACAAGFVPTTVYSTDFEAGDAGFTHSGTQDEWQRGTPNTPATTTANPQAPFTTCNSGTNCWKTDLLGGYNASSNQDLLSPNINLAGLSPPVVVTWAQRHQVESANFDRYFVDFQQVGGANPIRLYEWTEPTIISASAGTGNPQTNIGSAAGWGVFSRRADALAGQNAELRFNLTSDTTVNFSGVAVDDVSVTACRALSADLAITKTDGVTTATPGGSVTYTITASNAGADPVASATVADTFPATLNCTWTCVGAGGGTCTASGAGNLNDTVSLPVGGSTTYTASCTISPSATGSLTNTATVSSAVSDPTPANNSATDTDTLVPQADLSITKTNGVTQVNAGSNTVYTIVASNAGPSNAPGSTVADTFPASCTSVNWTCVGAGGGACTASGSGNLNDTVFLPSGGSVTYTATCAINAAASGTLSNTATVAAGAGVTDPTAGNNSATDTDTIIALTADVAITKTDGQTSDTAGTTISYTIVASNAGPAAAPSVTVADTLPATLTGVTWTCVGAGGGTCTASGSGNLNTTANLPSGGSATYTVNATIAPSATGVLSNTATATANAPTTDPNPANNSATDTTTLTADADLQMTLTSSVAQVLANVPVTFIATSLNAGPSDAQDVSITLTLSPDLRYSSHTATGATCTTPQVGNSGVITCTWAGATAAGSARTLEVTAYSNSEGTSTVNASTTSPTNDPVANNNATSVSVVVGFPFNEIPSLGQWGLLMLGLLLAGLGLVAVRRQG